jgi:hypothetical protein
VDEVGWVCGRVLGLRIPAQEAQPLSRKSIFFDNLFWIIRRRVMVFLVAGSRRTWCAEGGGRFKPSRGRVDTLQNGEGHEVLSSRHGLGLVPRPIGFETGIGSERARGGVDASGLHQALCQAGHGGRRIADWDARDVRDQLELTFGANNHKITRLHIRRRSPQIPQPRDFPPYPSRKFGLAIEIVCALT